MARLDQAPPWVTFVSELEQMFKYDAEVHIVYDNSLHEVMVYVDSARKAAALSELLPGRKTYGNVELTVNVVPANGGAVPFAAGSRAAMFQDAFKGNEAFSFLKTVKGVFTNNLTYVVFKNRVVQYFDDNLGDIYGQRSTLYQEIAKDIFGENEGIFFCTDVEETTRVLGKPLGEWP